MKKTVGQYLKYENKRDKVTIVEKKVKTKE